jgi:hypothetical protein
VPSLARSKQTQIFILVLIGRLLRSFGHRHNCP